MIFSGNNGEILEVAEHQKAFDQNLSPIQHTDLAILWFLKDHNEIIIDTQTYHFSQGDIVFLTEFNKIEHYNLSSVRHIRFNHAFYCVISRDEEVSCKGNLFYGADNLPILKLTTQEATLLEMAWQMFAMEMQFSDETQLEMLQMMTRRILLILNRIYKQQKFHSPIKTDQIDILRMYSFLVESHFKNKHSVEEYALLLHKSPKTLANLFKKIGHSSPLQLIKNRITLEAKRLLKYTNTPISEIGYELGYDDIQSFSRFFRTQTGISPSDFRGNN